MNEDEPRDRSGSSPKNRRITAKGLGPEDDTPRDGVPSFSDIDASVSEDDESLAGPTPDFAQEYIPPRNLPRRQSHRTFEMQPVRVAEYADPRRAKTQKNLRTLQKEAATQAAAAAAHQDPAPDSTGSVAPVAPASTTNPRTQRTGLITAAIAGGLLLIAVVLLMSRGGTPDPSVEAVAQPQPAPQPSGLMAPAPGASEAIATAVATIPEPAPSATTEEPPGPTEPPTAPAKPLAAPVAPKAPSKPTTAPPTAPQKPISEQPTAAPSTTVKYKPIHE